MAQIKPNRAVRAHDSGVKMAQNEPRFGMPARRFKLAQFDRNHWHNKTGIGGTNRTVLSTSRNQGLD